MASKEENDFITTLSPKSSVWIDGKKNCSSGNCFWQWSGLNQKISYFNWRRGEPNNKGGIEDCITNGYEFEVNDYGVWNDRSCDARYGFVCRTAVSFI